MSKQNNKSEDESIKIEINDRFWIGFVIGFIIGILFVGFIWVSLR